MNKLLRNKVSVSMPDKGPVKKPVNRRKSAPYRRVRAWAKRLDHRQQHPAEARLVGHARPADEAGRRGGRREDAALVA